MCNHSRLWTAISLLICCFSFSPIYAGDYFLTLAGGYAPEGNQASLEANVLFFQQVLNEQQLNSKPHQIYFADGFDAQHDVQVLKKKEPASSQVLEQLSTIFRLPKDELIYRNHQVPKISGGLRSTEIRDGLSSIRSQLKPGDRLFIYVTAHGGAARSREQGNTSVSCWGNKPLRMTEFSKWLDELPDGVTVVAVMAQCYCGGFANTAFAGGVPENGFATNVRLGFFAQQADLPAAGCRPDVENDEEYSSYFWGAFAGRSRTGKQVGEVDCNHDGRISLVEAHAYAVVASNTIDIPLRTSDMLLRKYSKIAGYDIGSDSQTTDSQSADSQPSASQDAAGSEPDDSRGDESRDAERTEPEPASPKLAYFTGTIYETAAMGRVDEMRMIVGLAEKLNVPVTTSIGELTAMYDKQQRELRDARRFGMRRGRGSSSRRRLVETIVDKWPELEDPKQWGEAEVLAAENLDQFNEELQQLPGFEEYMSGQAQRQEARERVTDAELREVKFRRLLQQLESIVLAQNLPLVASAEVVERIRKIRDAEEATLQKF